VVAGITFLEKRFPFFHWCTKPWSTLYSGIVIADGLTLEIRQALFLFLSQWVQQRFDHARLTQSIPFEEVPPLGRGWARIPLTTLIVETEDIDGLWQRLGRKTRRNIRVAQRRGFTCEASAEPERLFDLYEQAYARQGIPLTFDKDRWLAITRSLLRSSAAQVYYSLAPDGTTANGFLVGYDSKRAYLLVAGTDRAAGGSTGGEFLLWHVIRAVATSRKELDLVGIATGGIGGFKRQFSPKVVAFAELVWWRSPPHKSYFYLMNKLAKVRRRPGLKRLASYQQRIPYRVQ
jgi:lipid II:glycine glycyltransferase (peptidoglycan interpeptide bridge formation enzyme)